MDSYELCKYFQLNLSPLQDQQVLLTAELSLLRYLFICIYSAYILSVHLLMGQTCIPFQ